MKKKTAEVERHTAKAATDVMLRWDFDPVVSIKTLEKEQFAEQLRLGFSFYENVSREGVMV